MRCFQFIVLALALAACGKSSGDSSSNPLDVVKETAKTSELQGKIFESNCKSPLPQKAFSAKGYRIQYHFVGNKVTRSTQYYPSQDCSGDVAFTFDEHGTVEHKGAGPEGTEQVDMHFRRLEATVNSEAGMNFAQRELSACGVNNWAIGEPIDVTASASNINCYQRPVPNDVHDIYRLDGTRLYLGNGYSYSRGGDPRPQQLKSEEPYYSKAGR